MEGLLQQSEVLKNKVSLRFKRYLYNQIDWKNRLIGIKGARGTGKTTILLQRLQELSLKPTEAAYFSMDDVYFLEHSLVKSIKEFYNKGGKYVFIDEVHKYENWSVEIKNIYDQLDDLSIIFTGSSIIDISKQEGDLSRRVLMHELYGLSYREYLQYTDVISLPSISLEEIIHSQINLSDLIPKDFRPYEYFSEYLSLGYYPFFKEDTEGYHRRIKQMVRLIVEYDMAELKGFDIRNAKKMLQLLQIVSQQVPFKPNLVKLAEKSGIHRNTILNYLHFLEEARLIKLLYPVGNSIANLQKPEKIFLNNTSLLMALSNKNNSIGTVRETFFFNQLMVNHIVEAPKSGDFIVNEKYVFEIGGQNKSSKQITNIGSNGFVVKDNAIHPIGNALPLWMFGLTY